MIKATCHLLIGVILFGSFHSFSQTGKQSQLYNDNGTLKADTSLIISKALLAKWIIIEDTFTKSILNRLQYPQIAKENVVGGRVIISFTIDSKGQFNDYRIEKFKSEFSKDTLQNDLKIFVIEIMQRLIFSANDFLLFGINPTGSQIDKYYLPFSFLVRHNKTTKKIEGGWLSYLIEAMPWMEGKPVIDH